MFNKLRLKLTFINVAIIMALFSILITGTFMLTNYGVNQGSYHVISKLSEEIKSGQLTDIPERNRQHPPTIIGMIPPPEPSFFYLKLKDKKIIDCSSGITIKDDLIPAFTETILNLSQPQGKISFANTDIIYNKTTLNDSEILIVCNDLSRQNELLQSQLYIFLLVGLCCALLSFAASFFMANKSIEPIRKTLENQKNFVSDASHELRTPLTIIQTNLDILKGADKNETIAENNHWIHNIQEETTRMSQLINSLLFLARADAKQQLLSMKKVQIDELIIETLNSFQVLSAKKSLQLEHASLAPTTILADEPKIRQVLTIILDNAIRHTDSNGTIITRLTTSHDKCIITINDTGEGIAKHHLPKLFDRFYQVDESRHKGGSGLGLSLAKWIIEQHHGSIAIDSQLNHGTTVTIKLPLSK